MSEVVAMLNSESVVLPEPNHAAYFNLRVSKVLPEPKYMNRLVLLFLAVTMM
jgi:hypothetical protein